MTSTWAAEQTILRLFRALDDNDDELALTFFAKTAVWRRPLGECVGETAIRQELLSRSRTRRIVHLVSNLIIRNRDELNANVTFNSLAFADNRPLPGTPSPMSLPIALDLYHAEMRVEDTRWVIARMECTRLFETAPSGPASQPL